MINIMNLTTSLKNKNYTAFDDKYWSYIENTYPDAFIDFKDWLDNFEHKNGECNYFDSPAWLQVSIFNIFANSSTFVQFKGTSTPEDAGLIYEWFNYYSELMGYTAPLINPRTSMLVHDSLFDRMPKAQLQF